MSSSDIPQGDAQDNDYVSRPGQKEAGIPVQSDNAPVESGVDETTADSDEQLARDEKEAIDESNIIDDKTRHAKPTGSYKEPGDDEGLPGPEDGTSSGAQ
ncbi:hypothetical protein WAI453_002171 [Rhynchosporium graminicola]|uniref:Histone chaperone domain-containing protein n=1 Tax=Rhynchosporium graminicola TaxID=2792576 RepID=A0A1E1KWU7_9HELO|nr:uncharacterized protein RCO7_09371 [Rhynchosporium commune]